MSENHRPYHLRARTTRARVPQNINPFPGLSDDDDEDFGFPQNPLDSLQTAHFLFHQMHHPRDLLPNPFIVPPFFPRGIPNPRLPDRHFQQILDQSFEQHQAPKRPTSKKFIDNLRPIKIVPSLLENAKECPICQSAFELGEQGIFQVTCEHLFHSDCILPWLKENNTCPVCRQVFPSQEDEDMDKKKRRMAKGKDEYVPMDCTTDPIVIDDHDIIDVDVDGEMLAIALRRSMEEEQTRAREEEERRHTERQQQRIAERTRERQRQESHARDLARFDQSFVRDMGMMREQSSRHGYQEIEEIDEHDEALQRAIQASIMNEAQVPNYPDDIIPAQRVDINIDEEDHPVFREALETSLREHQIEEERRKRQQLREQQDLEFNESLRRDQEKEKTNRKKNKSRAQRDRSNRKSQQNSTCESSSASSSSSTSSNSVHQEEPEVEIVPSRDELRAKRLAFYNNP